MNIFVSEERQTEISFKDTVILLQKVKLPKMRRVLKFFILKKKKGALEAMICSQPCSSLVLTLGDPGLGAACRHQRMHGQQLTSQAADDGSGLPV